MAETDWHRDLMAVLIAILKTYFAQDPLVYVSGNLLLFYKPGDKRRHLSPDVFVVKGVPKRPRPNYLVWEEGKGPDFVIELTSSSTRHEDVKRKFALYQDTLRVQEYFLFDPLGDYLAPPLRGYRLHRGKYRPIRPVKGRLPSKVIGLHLERYGRVLRLYDPATGGWLPDPEEARQQAEEARQRAEEARRQEAEARQQEAEARRRAEEARRQEAEARQQEAEARRQAEEARRRAEEARHQSEAEAERLRHELEELRRRLPDRP
jgi:Uma2 family endonuclease